MAMPKTKKSAAIELLIALLILLVCGIILFTVSMNIRPESNELKIKVLFYKDLKLNYEDIDHIEIRNDLDIGSREFGIGSVKLSVGTFKNDEFGKYTLYSYKSADSYIVIKTGDKTIVIGEKDKASADALFKYLTEKSS